MDVAVIGGGVFGVTTAIRLSEAGHAVSLFERLPELMLGTTSYGNRLHMGYHYPRDEETARQCARGYREFKKTFPSAILDGARNAYFIAAENGLTSANEFLEFCRRLSLPYQEVDPNRFKPRVERVQLGVLTDEVMFDPSILRRLLADRLEQTCTRTFLQCEVIDVGRSAVHAFEVATKGGKMGFDAIVNCCYADMDRLTAQLGHGVQRRHYEYVAVPIVELELPRAASITVLDGKFMCLLPFGCDGSYLLYDALNCVIGENDSVLLDEAWVDGCRSAFSARDEAEFFRTIQAACGEYVPEVRKARHRGFLQGLRMVLADAEHSDARPSIVTMHEDRYVAVFSGKIDHCIWVADEVLGKLDGVRS